MPTSKTLAYDDQAYQVPVVLSAATAVGANGVTTKFAAFTAMQVRGAVFGPNTVGTSATTPLMFVKSGTATTTTTFTALSSATTAASAQALATAVSLVQGDQFWVTHGTDATTSVSVALECYTTPGAALLCP